MLNMLEIRIFREHNVAGLTTPTTVFAFFRMRSRGSLRDSLSAFHALALPFHFLS
jgi:hypothetical protein